MKVYFHIGNPKAFSTSIQNCLSSCSDIKYIGFTPSPDLNNWYISDEISKILNYSLRVQNRYFFDIEKDKYRDHIKNIIGDTTKPVIFSSENVSMPFNSTDLPIEEKIRRIQEIIPYEVEFIVSFRNIFSSLKSIYKEFVKNGYSNDFEQYQVETKAFYDANFLTSLFPGHLVQQIKNVDSNARFKLLLQNDNNNFIDFLNNILKDH